MIYRLLNGRHARFENGQIARYGPGDELELSDGELAKIAHRVELVEPASAAEPETENVVEVKSLDELERVLYEHAADLDSSVPEFFDVFNVAGETAEAEAEPEPEPEKPKRRRRKREEEDTTESVEE